MESNVAGASLLAVTSSVGIFTALLPELSDVRKGSETGAVAEDVRMGEFASAALVVGIGFTATAMTKSATPLVVSVMSAGILIGVYESVLRATPKENTK